MSSTSDIYVGFWTNWSKGAVLGSTLTLANRNGVILVAALAIFIQVSLVSHLLCLDLYFWENRFANKG